ncbi:MAG: class I SAM-dependent methyltransferase [Acidobacteriota bacterium]|nr:class I SAM-dependent methyltransferase [Acidobacteriota bacterium]
MNKKSKNYLPALRFEFLTRFYDPLVRIITKEFEFKRALLAQADLQNNQTVLDIACGTGTLSISIKCRFPKAKVFALDADKEILQMARNKAKRYNAKIVFEQGFSDALPFADKTFDHVFSMLAFHHLTPKRKVKTLREILRVLKSEGEFHLADYGLPRNKSQSILGRLICIIDGAETTQDNIAGRLKCLMEENGFANVERITHFKTILGTIRLFKEQARL